MSEKFKLTLTTKVINGKTYGASPCVVTLFGSNIDGFAVCCNQEKWISSRDDCIEWLRVRGLSAINADLLLDLGTAVDQARKPAVPSLSEQEDAGLFNEEMQKFVDGVIEDVRSGHIDSQYRARKSLIGGIDEWVKDMDKSLVLRYAFQALEVDPPDIRVYLANATVRLCLPLLYQHSAYQRLPETQ